MNILTILDTETTGLDPKSDALIEVGAILYSVQENCIIDVYSSLIWANENAAYDINRIPNGVLRMARPRSVVMSEFTKFAERGDAMVAHRAEFDRGFLEFSGYATQKPWICSKFDIEWPSSKPGDGLVHVALSHGVGVTQAHRAITDCITLAAIFERVGDKVPELLQRALRPKARVVSLAPFADKDIVKSNGFQWEPLPKVWARNMAIEDIGKLPFKTRQESLR